MDSEEITRYCNHMERIKARVAAVDYFHSAQTGHLPIGFRMESIYLQYRKILELIAFSSLVSNLDKFSKAYKRFAKYWNAAELFRDLERINRDFYPVPQIEENSIDPGVKFNLVERKTGYLTKGEFLQLYGRTGDILHERNPYAGPPELDWFVQTSQTWRDKIVFLMSVHLVHLVGVPEVYLVHMTEPDGQVHHYTLKPTQYGHTAR